MKNINKNPNNKIPTYLIALWGTLTSFTIMAFLSGKIIDLPHETHEGEIITAIGGAIIIIVMFLLLIGLGLVINKYKKQDHEK